MHTGQVRSNAHGSGKSNAQVGSHTGCVLCWTQCCRHRALVCRQQTKKHLDITSNITGRQGKPNHSARNKQNSVNMAATTLLVEK
jgi:hypothetical protein